MTYPTGPVLMESVSGNDGRNGRELCVRGQMDVVGLWRSVVEGVGGAGEGTDEGGVAGVQSCQFGQCVVCCLPAACCPAGVDGLRLF